MPFPRLLISAVLVSLVSLRLCAAEAFAPVSLPSPREPEIPANEVTITAFGAVGDGRTSNTQAIAAAIEAVAAKGGGKVIVPAGLWLTGPIVFKSRIELHLEQGALLQFSGRREDYPVIRTHWEGNEAWRCQSPLSATNLEHIAITGSGVIDGAGEVWRPVKKDKLTVSQWEGLVKSGGVTDAAQRIWYPSAAALRGNSDRKTLASSDPKEVETLRDFLRPVLLSFVGCRYVKLEGVTFQNSPAWCLHPLLCEDLVIRRVQVRNPWYAQNGDGLDIESCRNVLLEDSTFDVGDDAICLKSGRDAEGRKRGKPTERVLVRRCTVFHGHGGFVVGSEMSGGVRDVTVENCVFVGTDVGLRFKSTRGRGGVVERIRISGVRMARISGEAILFDLFYMTKSAQRDPKAVPPVTDETPAFRDIVLRDIQGVGVGRAALFQGLPEMPLQNVLWEASSIQAREGVKIGETEGLTLRDVAVTAKKGTSVFANDSSKLLFERTQLPSGMEFSGARTSQVSLVGLPSNADVRVAPEVPTDAVRKMPVSSK